MISLLSIRDVGVLDAVSLELGPGLTVVSGETGAGKTMVVEALELLRGERADATRIRSGAPFLMVEATVEPPPPGADEWLADGDDELVVAREVHRDGERARSRARIGGRMAPVSALAEVLGAAVEVHGQSDSYALADRATQRELLDRVGGEELAAAAAVYRSAYSTHRSAVAELTELADSARDRARELDRLRFELAEIDAVAPEAGEEDAIAAERSRLEHAEALAEAARTAAAAVTADDGARDRLGIAVAALRAIDGVDATLDDLAARIEGAAAEVQDAAIDLASYAEDVEADPARLEELRERTAALAGLTRKYGPDAAAVVAYADEARARLTELDAGDERVRDLEAEVAKLADARDVAASILRTGRREAGARLADVVDSHLAELAMPGARLVVSVTESEPSAHGADRVELLLAANPGEAPLPLAKAASGGERSRVALALRLALADVDETAVMVFDEVDAGIGGATATEVGRKLALLARGRQVLCVTHLAQLAAFADAHVVVAKETLDGRTVARVRHLDDDDRLIELARMLSGSPDSSAAADHAAELREAAVASRSSHAGP